MSAVAHSAADIYSEAQRIRIQEYERHKAQRQALKQARKQARQQAAQSHPQASHDHKQLVKHKPAPDEAQQGSEGAEGFVAGAAVSVLLNSKSA